MAETGEFDMMTQYLVLARIGGQSIDIISKFNIDVIDPLTFDAPDMMVRRGGGIEAFLGATDFNLQNDPAIGHQLQVSIYRSEPDARQTFSYHIVYFPGSGVRFDALQFFQNNLPLGRQSHIGYPVHFISRLFLS